MIRFLHTADWQIGKPFGRFPPDERVRLREERFEAVGRLARLARERECAAVLVAGDAFDDNTVSDKEVHRTLEAMAAFPGPWVMLPGNHDAALSVCVWTRLRTMELRLDLRIADRPEPILLADGRLAVLPAPLTRRSEGADLTQWFDAAETPPGAARVGLAHGSVAHRLPMRADAGNPVAEDRAASARLDYLALGDWHGFLEIAPRTFYCGTPEADRHRGNLPGHVAIVAIDRPGAEPHVERVATGRFRWQVQELALSADDPARHLDDRLAAVQDPGETLLALDLSGEVGLADRIEIDAVIARWRPRFFDLAVRDERLAAVAERGDLDAIDVSGFVREAVETLRARSADPADPQREAAALALRLVFAEHRRLSAGGR